MNLPFSNSTPPSKEVELDDRAAGQMLDNIFKACDTTANAIPFDTLKSWGNYKQSDFRACKIIAGCALILLLLLPFFFVSPALSVSTEKQPNSTHNNYDLSVSAMLPVVRVTAQLDGAYLPVTSIGGGHYIADVDENGVLTFRVTLLNGKTEKFEQVVDSIDRDAPTLVSSQVENNILYLKVSDTGSGIDSSRCSLVSASGKTYAPLAFDEDTSTLSFPYEKESLNLFLCDRSGNELHAVFTQLP